MPTWCSYDASTTTLSGTAVSFNDPDETKRQVVLELSDSYSSKDVTLLFDIQNDPPVLLPSPPAVPQIYVEVPFTHTLDASLYFQDPENDPFTTTIVAQPAQAWLSLDDATLAISGTAPAELSFNLVVTLTSDHNALHTVTATIPASSIYNPAPVRDPAVEFFTEWELLKLAPNIITIHPGTAYDLEGETVTYSLSYYEDLELPSNLQFSN